MIDGMPDADTLRQFAIERSSVRGELVHLDATWQALLARCDYPVPVRELLGEALAAAALLAATVKREGSLILQLTGDGPLRLLVVQASRRTQLRGLAHWEQEVPRGSLREKLGRGRLVITIDPGGARERYQGIVDLDGESLAEVLHNYFQRSEGLPTRLWLASDARQAAGLLLQDLPGESFDEDAWERSVHLASTVTGHELLELSAFQILRRLFHQEDVRLLDPEPIRFSCRCSRDRVIELLLAMGHAEISATLAEQGIVSVRCEFCNALYEFDAVDVEALFAAGGQQPAASDTRH